MGKQRDIKNMIRKMIGRYADLRHHAIIVWKENVDYHNHTMKRVMLRLIDQHKRRESQAFYKWKESIDKKHMVQLVQFSEELMNEN